VHYIDLLNALIFNPKEHAVDILCKKYPQVDNYVLEVDLAKQIINL